MNIENLIMTQIQDLELLKNNSLFSSEQIKQIDDEIEMLKKRLKKKG